jgi:hypothetical protein
MRFITASLAALAIGATSVSALQNVYIGTIEGCSSNKYGPDWYVWFTDGPACTTGSDLGPTSNMGGGLCGRDVTILGHSGITFTGCPSKTGAPTGVSDGGAPALTCHPVSIPNQRCPSPCGYPYPDVTVTTAYQCS